jgi:hypothetical protein
MADKRIGKNEFNKILDQALPYGAKEKEFLKKSFEPDLSGGLTEAQLKSRLQKMKYDTKDPVSGFEADRLKSKFSGKFSK